MSLAKRAMDLPLSSPLRKEILEFLSIGKIEKALYTGKSKKILSVEVQVLKKNEIRSLIRDAMGNESTVSNTQLKFI